jgi:phosphate transport system substrate-binding protein
VTWSRDCSGTTNRSIRVNVRGLGSLLVAVVLASPACSSASKAVAQDLNGAGSSFAGPLYSRWSADYAAKSGVKVNYQPIGSGAGIKQFQEMTVDFGGTDIPMTDAEMTAAKGGSVLHVPTGMGAVVLTYNLPGITKDLQVSPEVIADIFLGKITKWNDPRIAKLNAGVKLPSTDVLVVHRSDGSGTTFIWTSYLTAVSPDWAKQVGAGKDVKWPVGLGGAQNAGVAGQVKQIPGAVGYVELAYARQNKLGAALVQNKAGNFVAPTIAGVTAAASSVAPGLPATTDFRVSIIDAPGKDAYPISSLTWALVYQKQSDAGKGKAIVDFLRYGLTDGQKSAETLDYAPLPDAIVKQLLARLGSIK